MQKCLGLEVETERWDIICFECGMLQLSVVLTIALIFLCHGSGKWALMII